MNGQAPGRAKKKRKNGFELRGMHKGDVRSPSAWRRRCARARVCGFRYGPLVSSTHRVMPILHAHAPLSSCFSFFFGGLFFTSHVIPQRGIKKATRASHTLHGPHPRQRQPMAIWRYADLMPPPSRQGRPRPAMMDSAGAKLGLRFGAFGQRQRTFFCRQGSSDFFCLPLQWRARPSFASFFESPRQKSVRFKKKKKSSASRMSVAKVMPCQRAKKAASTTTNVLS